MPIATLGVTALDCTDPAALAVFYATLIGGEVKEGTHSDWVEVVDAGGVRRLACQRVADYRPPQWPGQQVPQQLHLDFDVPKAEMDEAERQVLELGAELVQKDDEKQDFRVYLDPAGHPFCLCQAER